MGKNGAALRAAKRKNVTYTFTKEQLEAHDRLVLQEFKQRVKEDLADKFAEKAKQVEEEQSERLLKAVNDEWDERRRKFASENSEDNFIEMISCCLSVPVRVLVEHFGWKPILEGDAYDGRRALVRFSNYVHEEIEKIRSDDLMDIVKYNNETYKKYGVAFKAYGEE